MVASYYPDIDRQVQYIYLRTEMTKHQTRVTTYLNFVRDQWLNIKIIIFIFIIIVARMWSQPAGKVTY